MNKYIYNLTLSLLIGFLFTIPFFILEATTTSGYSNLGFPAVLFLLMWLNSGIFVFILISILRSLQNKKRSNTFYILLATRIALLIILAWAWIGLIIDQWPCFIGIPNCD